MRKPSLVSILFFCATISMFTIQTHAQITIEPQIQTDTISLFSSPAATSSKSSKIAIAATLLVPGLGHQYLGQKSAASAFISADVLCILGALGTRLYAANLSNSAKSYAWQYAGVIGNASVDDIYWRNVGQFLDSDGYGSRTIGYNQVMAANRTIDKAYTDPDLQWHWTSDIERKEYNKMLGESINFNVASSFFFGAMVINRLVAFIHIRASDSYRTLSSIKLVPTVSPSASALVINANF